MPAALELAGLGKSFTMHLQGGLRLPVVAGLEFAVHPGECVVLAGPSGAGKSSILKMIFGGYRCDRGTIIVRHGTTIHRCRRGQPAPDPCVAANTQSVMSRSFCARFRACPRSTWLPSHWWLRRRAGNSTPPGHRHAEVAENSRHAVGLAAGNVLRRRAAARQHRARFPAGSAHSSARRADGIARCCQSRAAVIDLIAEKKRRGTAIVAIVHDEEVRTSIADSVVDVIAVCSGGMRAR